MSSSHSGIASAVIQATNNPANPYGDPNQMMRSAIKAPITEKLRNSIEDVELWTWRVVIATAVVTTLGSVWIGSSSDPVAGPEATTFSIAVFATNIIAGTVLGIGLISGLILKFVARKQGKEVEQMQAGHYLARWDLDQQQWATFIEEEKEKANDVISTAAIVMVVLGLLMWIPFSGTFSFMVCISGILGLGLAGLVLGWVIASMQRCRLDRMSDNPRFTVIGHDGLYYNDAYHPYSAFGGGLSEVQKIKTGTMEYLVFTFFNQSSNGRNEYERRVPVPTGREEEASWILKQFD